MSEPPKRPPIVSRASKNLALLSPPEPSPPSFSPSPSSSCSSIQTGPSITRSSKPPDPSPPPPSLFPPSPSPSSSAPSLFPSHQKYEPGIGELVFSLKHVVVYEIYGNDQVGPPISTSLSIWRIENHDVPIPNGGFHSFKRGRLDVNGVFSTILSSEYPTFLGQNYLYCFLSRNKYWGIEFPLPPNEDFFADYWVQTWEAVLDDYTTFQKYPFEEKKELIETDRSRDLKHKADTIEKTGDSIAKGFLTVGAGCSKGARGVNQFYIEHSSSGSRQMTEEDRQKTQHREEQSRKIHGTTSKITGAISTGVSAVGTGIAKGGRTAKDKYDHTEYAKEKEWKKKEKGAETEDTSAAIMTLKATGHAIGTVASSVKYTAVGVATDARDCSVDRTLHSEGEEAAALRKREWDSSAHYCFAGVDGVRLFAYTNVGMLELGTKMGVKVGIAAAQYDELKKNVLFGGMYRAGWVAYRNDVLEGWINRWCVLRPLSIAFYSHPSDHFDHPIEYTQLRKVKAVKPASFHVIKRQHSIELLCSGKIEYLSLELQPGNVAITHLEEGEEWRRNQWIFAIDSLLHFN